MSAYRRDFTEGNVRMTLQERAWWAGVIATQATTTLPHGSQEQEAAYRVAARLAGPIVTREADPSPRYTALEVESWD